MLFQCCWWATGKHKMQPVGIYPTSQTRPTTVASLRRGFPYPMIEYKEVDHRVAAVIPTMIHYINFKLP